MEKIIKKEQRKSCCSYGYVATNDATIVFILFQILVNCISELLLPCGTVVLMEGASGSRNNYSSLARRFWLFVPIRAYSLMPLSL